MPELVAYFLVLFFSQLIYFIIQKQQNQVQIDSEIATGNVVSLLFSILAYYYSDRYDENL